jgi:hypothetical protein
MCAQSVVLFLKANPNHDRLGRFARAPADGGGGKALDGNAPELPSSASIATVDEARDYWRKHIAARGKAPEK